MRNAINRRFTVIDALVLIAATALGFAGARAYYGQSEGVRIRQNHPVDLQRLKWSGEVVRKELGDPFLAGLDRQLQLMHVVGAATCVLSPWMLALLLLKLRNPRPTRRRMMQQPGTVACIAVAVAIAIECGMRLTYTLAFGPVTTFTASQIYWPQFAEHVRDWAGPAIASVWMVLLVGRRWRPAVDWIDRAGILLGAVWIVTCIFGGTIIRLLAG